MQPTNNSFPAARVHPEDYKSAVPAATWILRPRNGSQTVFLPAERLHHPVQWIHICRNSVPVTVVLQTLASRSLLQCVLPYRLLASTENTEWHQWDTAALKSVFRLQLPAHAPTVSRQYRLNRKFCFQHSKWSVRAGQNKDVA